MKENIKVSEKEMVSVYPSTPIGWIRHYGYTALGYGYAHNFPWFDIQLIPIIQRDPRIRYALQLLKGPIQGQTAFIPEKDKEDPGLHEVMRELGVQFVYAVKASSPQVEEHVLETLSRFWQNGIKCALSALDWGFSCSQILYKKQGDQIQYNALKFIHPLNVKPLISRKTQTLKGIKQEGVSGEPNGLFLPRWKVFWHVHEREHNPFIGQSRLEWAFVPWHETWVQYGARDIRRTWFHRNSYDGGTMRFPIGKSKLENGEVIENRELAMQMMANLQTGGFRLLTNEVGPDGKTPKWDYEPPSANITPQGLMDYPEQLRMEILEAMGIPPEVVESSSESGFGSATGRKIPMLVYFSTLVELINYLLTDVKRFILDITVTKNFGPDATYDIQRVMPLKAQEKKQTDALTNTEKDTGLSV